MNNSQIGARIKRLAALMSLLDENVHKIRTFTKAAQTIEKYPEEMGVLIDEDRLTLVPGIGDNLAHIILYYAKSGGPAIEKELEARLPKGLPELLTIKGLGTQKVKTLWQDYGVNNLSDLEHVCLSHELSTWQGFGSKLEQNLLQAISFYTKNIKDFLLDQATKVAAIWQARLSELVEIESIALTGQLRRSNELIRSVDFIVQADMEELRQALSGKLQLRVTETDPLKLIDPSGLPIHLWVCHQHEFAVRQLVLTGGDIYLEKLDEVLAGKQLVRKAGRIPGISTSDPDEKELCQQIGIQWIEPSLRDRFNAFPDHQPLIHDSDIQGVLHVHSTWSDGRNSLEQMVTKARELGYRYLGISDHSQAAYYANGLKPDRVQTQWKQIDELNEKYADIHIFKGIEADILSDGALDYDDTILAGFDFVIASIHSHFHLDSTAQTDRIIRALQSPYTTILGHPTGRMLLSREGYKPDIRAIIDAAAEYGKVIEINTTPKRLDLDWRYLGYAKERGVKVSINPDAHSLSGLETIPYGVLIAQKGGLSPDDVLNTLDANAFQSFIRKQRSK